MQGDDLPCHLVVGGVEHENVKKGRGEGTAFDTKEQ